MVLICKCSDGIPVKQKLLRYWWQVCFVKTGFQSTASGGRTVSAVVRSFQASSFWMLLGGALRIEEGRCNQYSSSFSRFGEQAAISSGNEDTWAQGSFAELLACSSPRSRTRMPARCSMSLGRISFSCVYLLLHISREDTRGGVPKEGLSRWGPA